MGLPPLRNASRHGLLGREPSRSCEIPDRPDRALWTWLGERDELRQPTA